MSAMLTSGACRVNRGPNRSEQIPVFAMLLSPGLDAAGSITQMTHGAWKGPLTYSPQAISANLVFGINQIRDKSRDKSPGAALCSRQALMRALSS